MRIGLVAGVAAGGLALLTACSQPERGTGDYLVTHAKAKAEVENLYELTTAIVGGGWDESDREWRECGRQALTGTDSWARFNQRFGPLAQSPSAIADQVATLWNRLGYPVTVVADDTITPPRMVVSYPPYLTGPTTDGFSAVFTVGEEYADFDASSRCVASDPSIVGRYPS
jgi:hypothetical protein